MKKISVILVLLFASGLYANNGEEIFKAKCASCHLINPPAAMSNPGTPEFKKAINDLKAPPMSKVALWSKCTMKAKRHLSTLCLTSSPILMQAKLSV